MTNERTRTDALAAVAVLYRCKPCKQTMRAAYWQRTVSEYGFFNGRNTATHTTTIFDADGRRVGGFDPKPCGCGRTIFGAAIKARLVPSIKCSAKCRNAVGPSCDCSCGGAHHAAH